MAVISINITESSQQVIDGIPRSITIETNVPAFIFYSLDGTPATDSSNVYTNQPIIMPTDVGTVTLNIFTTNSIDTGTFEKTYSSGTYQGNVRRAHTPIANPGNQVALGVLPYSSTSNSPTYQYLPTDLAGITVNNPQVPDQNPGGYDGKGGRTGATDLPLSDYNFIYSATNDRGEVFKGVGNLPARVKIKGSRYPEVNKQESSSNSDKLFNPKAQVIFQDSAAEGPNDPVNLIPNQFSLENPEVTRDGNNLLNVNLDAPTATGSFVRSEHNPRTNELVSYYYDNSVNRWIISKTPYDPRVSNPTLDLSMVFPSRGTGIGTVTKWIPFVGRKIF